MRDSQNSFNGGELSDWLDSRADLFKTASGCRTLLNSHPVRYGGARRRSGFLHCGEAAAANVRLEGFNFSRTVGYVLEFSALKIRVWNTDGTQVLDGGSPLELTTPYLDGEIFALDFAQKNDVIIVTHPLHPPLCLKHAGPTDWTVEDLTWKNRPWSDFNATETTITLTKPGTPYLGTFSANTLDSSWEGSFLRIRRPISSQFLQTSFNDVQEGRAAGSTLSWQTFNPATSYDPDPATAGRRNHVVFLDGFDSGHDTLWRCISPYTANDGVSTDPGDYPTQFAQGMIAIGPVLVTGKWEFETKGSWTGTWRIERSYDNGTTWEEVASVFSLNDSNSIVTEEETPEKPALFRVLAYTANADHPDNVYLRVFEGEITTEFEIDTVNSATEAELTALSPVETIALGEASADWSDNAFSEKNGYPVAVTFHEARLFFAGTGAEPDRIWASRTEDFFNFAFGTAADNAFTFPLNANRYNAIVWMVSQQSLIVGTIGGEWASFTAQGGPMTPEDTNFHQHTHHGSDPVPGLVLEDAAVFVQRQGRKIREFAPTPSGFSSAGSTDLTELAEHITRGGIKQLTDRNSPDTELFALRNDGVLASLIFERSQQIYAWHRITTPGTIKSVATLYGEGEDDAVFIAVAREIEGVTTTFIERLSPDGVRAEEENDPTNFVSLDHAFTSLPLPSSYEGLEVSAHAGFEDLGTFTVGAGGTVAIPGGKSNVVVGLNYESEIEPLPVTIGGYANKHAHNSAHIRLRNSSNFKVANSGRETFNTIKISETGEPVNIDKVITLPGRAARNSSVVIKKDRPGPLSVVSLDLETQTGTR